jgi:hypothetical protein
MMKSFKPKREMKRSQLKTTLIWLVIPFLFLAACENADKVSESKADLALNENSPAAALTIGWYLPIGYLQKLVGPDFTPVVAKSDTLGVMKLVISSGDAFFQKGIDRGKFSSAILLIEVEKPSGLFKSQPSELDHTYVCPVTIIDESLPMATAFYEHGFVTEKSNVILEIRESNGRVNVEANIKYGENSLLARCFFEDLPVDGKARVMMINQTRPLYGYLYGDERFNRYTNGKGRLDREGTTLITTLGIQNIPYFFVLDKSYTWIYDFGN